jgi:hypothetical protein
VMEWPSMFRDVQALMIGLDCVLYVDEDPIAGAIEAVGRLRRRGLRLRFVTNTTARNGDLSIVSSAAHPATRHECRTGPGRPRPDGPVLLLATSAHAGPLQPIGPTVARAANSRSERRRPPRVADPQNVEVRQLGAADPT